MLNKTVDWNTFNSLINIRTSKFYYTDDGNEYFAWTNIDGVILECHIDKDDTDTVTAFQSRSEWFNKRRISEEGIHQVSLNYGELVENPLWTGGKFTATAGQVTFFDFEITELMKLIGGETFVSAPETAHKNDYIEVSMIDKNDILGYFGAYGLTVGQDILELRKFVKKLYVRESRFAFDNVYGAKFDLVTGLFVRFAYNSYGSTDMEVAVQLFGTT